MTDPWFFLIGMPVGGLAVYLFYLGRLRELDEELATAKRAN